MLRRVFVEDTKEHAQIVIYMNHQGNVNVKCTCKSFEACGWLCCHCLRIFHNHSIDKIPEKYVLSRWTKGAKKVCGGRCSTTKILVVKTMISNKGYYLFNGGTMLCEKCIIWFWEHKTTKMLEGWLMKCVTKHIKKYKSC